MTREDERFARTDLPGGLTVLSEEMPGVRSVSLGVWVRGGPIAEAREEMGASHLLEHMAFKGTRRLDAGEIALVVERLGGSLDAYTAREHTSYQARVLDEHVDTALDVLAELVLSPALRAEDLEREREVVLEEIATVEDTPDDLVFELHGEALWGDHPYGYRILGTRESVGSITAERLRRTHERWYRRANLLVAAAGGVRHDAFVARVRERFADARAGGGEVDAPEPSPVVGREVRIERPTSQTHIVFGAKTFGYGDPRRYALALVSAALGGGMSSRLFRRVREELGLAYTVYSYQSFYRRAGVTGVYVGTRPEWAERARDVVRGELARLASEGLSERELEDAKGQLKGQLVLSLESSGARLQRLAGFVLFDRPFLTLDALMARIDDVAADEVAAVAAEHLDPEGQVVVRLGPGGRRTQP
ncbi:MAG: M16 family metallopeptidase [Gemmatimonadota bacterium]